jgi:tetratricopeptide (TPR) repeat protein
MSAMKKMRNFIVAAPRTVILALLLAALGATASTARDDQSFAAQLLEAGETELQELRYSEAIAYLSEALKLASASEDPSDQALIPRAHELRAMARMNMGDAPSAEKDFAALVQIDPTHDLDRQLTPPKILEVFDRVREARTAVITLHCDPPDCRVSLGPQMVEILAPIVERRVRAGDYHVRIERQGFEPLEETWAVQPGQRVTREVRLVQNSQSFQVMTIPPGGRVLLDGVEIGVTRGPAPTKYQDHARKEGVSLAELSAPLLVPYVAVGKHELRIERRCHQTARYALEVRPEMRSTQPITFKPVRLKAELAALELRGHPSGAEVWLDGKSIGSLPVRREGVCAGTHQVEARFPTGARWYNEIELPAGRTHRLQIYPRPSLSFLGLVQVGSSVRSDRRQIEAQLVTHLERLRSLNVDRLDRSKKERGTWASLVSAAPIEGAGQDLLATRLGSWVDSLSQERRPDLALGAVLRRRGQSDEVALYLVSTLGGSAEVRQAPTGSKTLDSFFASLDRPTGIEETWVGWTPVDVPGAEAPIIATVAAQGPAARAGLEPGDQIQAVDGEPVGSARDLRRLMEAIAPGETIRVTRVAPDGSVGALTLAPQARPSVLPLDHPEVLYHAAHAHLQHLVLGGADGVSGRLAALNLGVVLLHFGRAEEALVSYLEPASSGVLQPIVHYLRFRAYEKLGKRSAARKELQAAARFQPSPLEPINLPVSILSSEALGRSLQ